jgi:hypothetical protein
MANINAAFGLRPYRMLGSGANTSGDIVFDIQTTTVAGTANVIYNGSPMIPLANGMVDIVGAAAGGTVPLLGVFIGCNYIDLSGKPKWSPYWPGTAAVKANTAATATIVADPDATFAINCNAATPDTIIHSNANFALATSGVLPSGQSSAVLDVSTVNTTNTLNMRILGFENVPSNSDPTVAGRIAVVQLNNHFYRYGANGLGAGV